MAEELLHRHADVYGDLAQERRCNVAPLMRRDRRAAGLNIAELLVGTALAHNFKALLVEDVSHLQWLENPELTRRSNRYGDLLQTYEIALRSRFALLQEHGDHHLEIGL